MKKSILALTAVAAFAASNYFSYGYGVSTVELAVANDNVDTLLVAKTLRNNQVLTESSSVIASMENAVVRDTEIEKKREKVAGYEAELQIDRTVACNLSADTIASMQQHAAKGASKQLGADTGIDTEFTAYLNSDAINWQSSGNGEYLVDKRWDNRRFDLQSHRYPAGHKIASEATIATWSS